MTSTGASELRIRFPDLTPAEAGRAASELQGLVRAATAGRVDTALRKERSDTQDAGTILAIVLGAPAVVALANRIAGGIGDYLGRLNSRVEIVTESGTVIATGSAAERLDLGAVAQALSADRRDSG